MRRTNACCGAGMFSGLRDGSVPSSTAGKTSVFGTQSRLSTQSIYATDNIVEVTGIGPSSDLQSSSSWQNARHYAIVMIMHRLFELPNRSFFVFGPRGVGKSTWLRGRLPDATWFDLLSSRVELELRADPSRLRDRLVGLRRGAWVVIDEVQKVPPLLDEVHALIESQGLRFALSGSSARKLKRGGANLLAGRASIRHMAAFSLFEVPDLSIPRALEHGLLPMVVTNPKDAHDILHAYVHTYLKEEIREEGLVRQVDPFVRFLRVAGQMNGQLLNVSSIATNAQVPRNSVANYFSILEDTLVGSRLAAYQPGSRIREVQHPKFYWFDVGVARAAAEVLFDPIDPVGHGYALETWVLHELKVYNEITGVRRSLFHYKTGADVEVDFVVETRKKTLSRRAEVVLIEVKTARRWNAEFERHLHATAANANFDIRRKIGIYLGTDRLRRNDIDVFPLTDFVAALHSGEIF